MAAGQHRRKETRSARELRRSLRQAHGTSQARRAKATGKKRGHYQRGDVERVQPANLVAVAVLRFLALSGWREGEALTLRPDALDVGRDVAVLADTKTGRSVRQLGKAALDVLTATIGNYVTRGNPYVFVGAKAGEHLRETKRLWTAVKHAAGVRVRLHDLRHSFTTVGRELDCSDYTIARLVGHVVEGMTGRYGDVPDETMRKAANAIAQTIANRLAGRQARRSPFPVPRARSSPEGALRVGKRPGNLRRRRRFPNWDLTFYRPVPILGTHAFQPHHSQGETVPNPLRMKMGNPLNASNC